MHLWNYFKQYHWLVGQKCDPSCLVCDCPESLAIDANALPNSGGILNISATEINPSLNQQLAIAKGKGFYRRLWWSHRVDQLVARLDGFDEIMVRCPSPEKEVFNRHCGQAFFDKFKAIIRKFDIKATCVFSIQPMDIGDLPDCYELVHELNVFGMIFHCPSAFDQEQLRYIARFKRVPRMRVLAVKDVPSHRGLCTPNTMGSLAFNWADWSHAMRMTLQRWPLIKYAI